jgi:hypothetical protein
VLELKVDLSRALRILGVDEPSKAIESRALTMGIEPLLRKSSSPYVTDLRARFAPVIETTAATHPP